MYFVKVLLVYWQNHYQVTCNFLITPQSKKKKKEEEERKQNKMVNHAIEKSFHLFKPYPMLTSQNPLTKYRKDTNKTLLSLAI